MSRSARIASGVITNVIQFGISTVLQLTLIPVVLRFAGAEALGAYAILIQAIAYIGLVDIGLSPATMRYGCVALGRNDDGESFRVVFTTARTCIFIVNLLFAGGVLLFSLFGLSMLHLPDSVLGDARLSLYALSIWAVMRAPWATFGGGLIATQHLAASNALVTLANALRLCLSLLLVVLGYGLIGLMLSNILSEVVGIVLSVWLYKKLHPNLQPSWGIPDVVLLRDIFRLGMQTMVGSVTSLFTSSSDNLIVGSLRGATAVSAYYTSQTPMMTGYGVINMLPRNSLPAIYELYGSGDTGTLRKAFLRLHKYTWMGTLPLAVGVLVLNRDIINVWAGSKQYAGDLMTYVLALFPLVFAPGVVSTSFVVATAKVRTLTALSVVEALVKLALSVWLCASIGFAGPMIGTLVAHLPTAVYLQWRVQSLLKIGFGDYCRLSLLPCLLPLMIGSSTLAAIKAIVGVTTLASLAGVVAIFTAVYAGFTTRFSLDHQERSNAVSFFRGTSSRVRKAFF